MDYPTNTKIIEQFAKQISAKPLDARDVKLSLDVCEKINSSCASLQLRLDDSGRAGIFSTEVKGISALYQKDGSALFVGVLGESRKSLTPSEETNWNTWTWRPLGVIYLAWASPDSWNE